MVHIQVLPYLNFVNEDMSLKNMLHGVINRQVIPLLLRLDIFSPRHHGGRFSQFSLMPTPTPSTMTFLILLRSCQIILGSWVRFLVGLGLIHQVLQLILIVSRLPGHHHVCNEPLSS